MPHRPGPLAAVVLPAGSGSLDRDETIGRNKPFKDIAWRLATHGAAVLGFDKVTYAHASEMQHADQFTLSDEYLPHALAAAECRRTHRCVPRTRLPRGR